MQHQLVKYKSGTYYFEIATNLGSVLKYRDGKIGWDKVAFTDEIFKNLAKGERATRDELKQAFGTDNVQECLKKIVDRGDLQLTTQERKEKVEQKRAEIVTYIHKYYINPKTNTPHPVVRIENALETLKFRVDSDLPAERQAIDIIKKLPEIMPIKRSDMHATLTVSLQFVGQIIGIVQQWAKLIRESYTSESCIMELSVIPGDYDNLLSELNKATKGEYEFEIEGHQEVTEETSSNSKKQKSERGRGKPKK